jgi:beta-glucosidase-like glycosyl hydrolase
VADGLSGVTQLFTRPPTGTPTTTVTNAANQAVGTDVADTAATLLKNSSHTLPLSANDAGNVAVIGPAASTQPIYGSAVSSSAVPPIACQVGSSNSAGCLAMPAVTAASWLGVPSKLS